MSRVHSAPALLVDLDGTVADSLAVVQNTILLAADRMHKPHPSPTFMACVAGPPLRATMTAMGWSPDEVEEGLRIYSEHYDKSAWREVHAFPGIGDQLALLHEAGYRLYLATSKRQEMAERTLEHEGLLSHFDFIGGAGNDGVTRQSKSDVIEYVLRENGDDPTDLAGRYLMIGDRIHDIEGAAVWGIPTMLCEWGTGAPEEWEEADYRAKDINNLAEVVREVFPA